MQLLQLWATASTTLLDNPTMLCNYCRSAADRAVLLFDVWHPALSRHQVRRITQVFSGWRRQRICQRCDTIFEDASQVAGAGEHANFCAECREFVARRTTRKGAAAVAQQQQAATLDSVTKQVARLKAELGITK